MAKRLPKGLGKVRQERSGRWSAQTRDADGNYWPAGKTFDTKLDAVAWLQAQQKAQDLGTWEPPTGDDSPTVSRGKAPTLAEYAALWLDERELKPLTRQGYEALLRVNILPALGDERVDRISPTTVRRWYADLAPGKETTRARAYGLLRTILGSAVDDELLPTNPARIRGAGSVKRAKTITVATVEEVAVITEEMPERLRCMILLAAWCGLRFGEIAELRRSDLDLDAGIVRVRRGVTRVEGEHVVSTPKSEAGMRDVVVPPHIIDYIADHLQRFTGPEPGDLLFPADRGGHLTPSTFYGWYYPAREAANRPDLRFHDLRHTQAVLLAQNGATLADLMSRLGHSTPQAAMRYQHSAEQRDRMLAERLSESANVVALDARRAKA